MTRNEVIAGSIVMVLAFGGAAELFFDKGAKPQAAPTAKEVAAAPVEAPPPSVEDVVSGLMSRIEGGTAEQKRAALASLLDQLESDDYAKETLEPQLSEPLVKAAAAAVSVSTEAETPELGALRRRFAYFIAARTRGETSKEFVLQQLKEGTEDVRAELVKGVGRPHGVGGRDVFASVLDLGEKGAISGEILPGALRRLGGKKARPAIMAQLAKAQTYKEAGACVTALQDYQDPSMLGPALERLDQLGLLGEGTKLPWMSPKLFGAFIDKADGAELKRGLQAAKTRPSLVKVSMEAVKRGLESGDAETRLVAAQAVRKAVVGKVVQAKDSQTLLSASLSKETDPSLKTELTGALKDAQDLIPSEEEPHQ